MKKYFHKTLSATLLVLTIVLVSGLAFPATTHAAQACKVGSLLNLNITTNPACTNAGGVLVETTPEQQVAGVAWAKGCGVTEIGCQITEKVIPFVMGMVLKMVALLTGLSAIVLNGVVYYTVVKISENYAGIPAINEAWKVIRDISNMGFIFVLLYASIKTILGMGSDTKKLIVSIVTVAILVNFSLFFTKFVIDVSNLLALTFYDAIAPGSLAATGGFNLQQAGLSNAFMQHLSLQTLYKAGENLGIANVISIGVMGSIMLLIAAFVFFAVALMFIIRYVILILVLILSPIAFVAFVLPGLDGKTKEWWNALSGQAFFAPIYFMLTWVTLHVLGGIMTSFGTPAGSAQASLSGLAIGDNGVALAGGAFVMLINFIVVIVFLIASLLIAKSWADKTGHGVSKLTSWATGAAGATTLGIAGRFGRGTIGRASEALSENKWLKDRAPNSIAARLALATTRKTAGASFDVRGAGFASNLDAGKGQKGGFTKDMEEKIKAEKKYADSLKPSEIEISRAERALEDAKKIGGNEGIRRVADAQNTLDKLKGASEEDIRNRKIKELRAGGKSKKDARDEVNKLEDLRLRRINDLRRGGMSEEAAKAQAKTEGVETAGLEIEKIKGVGVERKEAYAKNKEASTTFNVPLTKGKVKFSWTGRVGFIGKVKRERLEEAIAIRKSIKEKKPAEKIAEEIKSQTESAADTTAGPETTPPPSAEPSTPTP